MRQWTEKERKRQACVARRSKPWENSTGPKTPEGKERSKMNAFKEGLYTPEWQVLRHALLLQRAFVRGVLIWNEAQIKHQKLRERTDKEGSKIMEKQ